MADKNYSNDEYQFNDNETSGLYGTAQMDSDSIARVRQVRRIIFIFALIAIIFAIYKLTGWVNAKRLVAKKAPPAAVQQAAVFPKNPDITAANTLPPPNNQAASVAQSQPTIPVLPQSSNTMNQPQLGDTTPRPNGLPGFPSASMNASAASISKFQSDMEDLKATVQNVQRNVGDVSDNMQNLQAQLQRQQDLLVRQQEMLKSLQAMLKKSKKANASAQKSRLFNPYHYAVDAMLPGRAWLKKDDGTTFTVSIGDRVPGYEGVVDHIDPQAGAVVMTSGQSITYRPDDR